VLALPTISRDAFSLDTLSRRAVLLPVSIAPAIPVASVVFSTVRPSIPGTSVISTLGPVRVAIAVSVLSLRGDHSGAEQNDKGKSPSGDYFA
jgi:hypothetical protein